MDQPKTKTRFSLRAYFELLRVPNVFTAAADVMMGYLVTQGTISQALPVAYLIASSCCLYLAGMVLNDVFDAEVDANERPTRPIPSGRVRLSDARLLGSMLLLAGIAFPWYLSFSSGNLRPGIVATILAATILLYDSTAKKTFLGPLAMASCRFLNVLLGMSLGATLLNGGLFGWSNAEWLIASGIGIYTLGISLLAKDEAGQGRKTMLISGTIVLLAGMATLMCLPQTGAALALSISRWRWLWILLAGMISWRCVKAILNPHPLRIQAAVKHAILSIIFLDATVTAGVCGANWGVVVLALVIPAMTLGRWFHST